MLKIVPRSCSCKRKVSDPSLTVSSVREMISEKWWRRSKRKNAEVTWVLSNQTKMCRGRHQQKGTKTIHWDRWCLLQVAMETRLHTVSIRFVLVNFYACDVIEIIFSSICFSSARFRVHIQVTFIQCRMKLKTLRSVSLSFDGVGLLFTFVCTQLFNVSKNGSEVIFRCKVDSTRWHSIPHLRLKISSCLI